MLHLYNSKLEFITSIPREFKDLETYGCTMKDFYSKWKNNWYALETKIEYPKLDDTGNVVSKTDEELKIEGIYPLVDGEYLEDGKLIIVEKPEGYKIVWESPTWVEKATDIEIAEIEREASIRFYKEELDYASKATAEYACGTVTEAQFEEVKMYIQEINPYKAVVKISNNPIESTKRPSIFDRY
ncbi:MAG: hypothetical protein ACRC1P_08870 [Cellulosilyticaceae bacterium]